MFTGRQRHVQPWKLAEGACCPVVSLYFPSVRSFSACYCWPVWSSHTKLATHASWGNCWRKCSRTPWYPRSNDWLFSAQQRQRWERRIHDCKLWGLLAAATKADSLNQAFSNLQTHIGSLSCSVCITDFRVDTRAKDEAAEVAYWIGFGLSAIHIWFSCWNLLRCLLPKRASTHSKVLINLLLCPWRQAGQITLQSGMRILVVHFFHQIFCCHVSSIVPHHSWRYGGKVYKYKSPFRLCLQKHKTGQSMHCNLHEAWDVSSCIRLCLADKRKASERSRLQVHGSCKMMHETMLPASRLIQLARGCLKLGLTLWKEGNHIIILLLNFS